MNRQSDLDFYNWFEIITKLFLILKFKGALDWLQTRMLIYSPYHIYPLNDPVKA